MARHFIQKKLNHDYLHDKNIISFLFEITFKLMKNKQQQQHTINNSIMLTVRLKSFTGQFTIYHKY